MYYLYVSIDYRLSDLMGELGIELQVDRPAEIRAPEPHSQKHDRRDADLILKPLAEDRFPSIWPFEGVARPAGAAIPPPSVRIWRR